MNDDMKSYVIQKVRRSILNVQHEKRSDRQEQFCFLVYREATYQKSEEIFEGYEQGRRQAGVSRLGSPR